MRIWCQLRWYFIHCMRSFLRHDQLIIRLIGCCHGPDINMDDVALEAFTTDLDKIMITMTLLISMTIPLFMCNLWNPNLHLSNPFQFLIFMSLRTGWIVECLCGVMILTRMLTSIIFFLHFLISTPLEWDYPRIAKLKYNTKYPYFLNKAALLPVLYSFVLRSLIFVLLQ